MGKMEHNFQRFDPGGGCFKTHVWRHVYDPKHAWGRNSSVVRVDEGWNVVQMHNCRGRISMLVVILHVAPSSLGRVLTTCSIRRRSLP